MLVAYAGLLAVTLYWFLSFPVEYRTDIDVEVVKVLVETGTAPEKAVQLAMSRVEVIGRPSGYVFLISTMFAAAPFIFGVYLNGKVEKHE